MEYRELALDFMEVMLDASSRHNQKRLQTMIKGETGEKFIICYLALHEKVLPGKIAQQMNTTTAHVAKLLRGLDARGCINRTLDVNDRRRILVSLTDKGREEANQYAEGRLDFIESVFRRLGEEDATAYTRITKKLLALYEEDEKENEGN